MSNITLNLNIAKALASMVSFTAKDVQRLDRVYVEVLPNSVSAVASDRYAIIESIYIERNGEGSLKFEITEPIAKFINSLKNVPLVTFELDGTHLKVSAHGTSATFDNSQSIEFDKIWDMLTNLTATPSKATELKPVNLNVALLSRAAKLLDYNGKKIEIWQFELGQSEGGNKPAPIHGYAGKVISYHLIQQPTLAK